MTVYCKGQPGELPEILDFIGNYSITVQCTQNDGNWSSEFTLLKFTVLPQMAKREASGWVNRSPWSSRYSSVVKCGISVR